MECAARLLLQLAIQVDQQVSAGNQIDARKRWVAQHAVAREQHDVADLLPNAILIAIAGKEAAQPVLADVGLDCERKPSLAGNPERPCIEIRAEHLYGRPSLVPRR